MSLYSVFQQAGLSFGFLLMLAGRLFDISVGRAVGIGVDVMGLGLLIGLVELDTPV